MLWLVYGLGTLPGWSLSSLIFLASGAVAGEHQGTHPALIACEDGDGAALGVSAAGAPVECAGVPAESEGAVRQRTVAASEGRLRHAVRLTTPVNKNWKL